MMINKITMR